MASEKAAAEFQLEKELNRVQEIKVCLQVSKLCLYDIAIICCSFQFVIFYYLKYVCFQCEFSVIFNR